jgi:hypothetical protein
MYGGITNVSLIRSTSNPDLLYVFENRVGVLSFLQGTGPELKMRKSIFSTVLKRWQNEGLNKPISYRGARFGEVEYPDDVNQIGGFRLVLRNQGWGKEIVAYETTWMYVACQFRWFKKGKE